jgi:hypothetical protein
MENVSQPLQDAPGGPADSHDHAPLFERALSNPGDDTMKPRPRLLLTIFMCSLAAGAATLGAVARSGESAPARRADAGLREAPSPAPVSQADTLFMERRFAEAYGRYAERADAGDRAAASMALAMVVNGPTLFGSDWSATSGQLQRWNTLARQFAEERELSTLSQDRGE